MTRWAWPSCPSAVGCVIGVALQGLGLLSDEREEDLPALLACSVEGSQLGNSARIWDGS